MAKRPPSKWPYNTQAYRTYRNLKDAWANRSKGEESSKEQKTS